MNEVNHIETGKLLAKYDKFIRDHLDPEKGNKRYTSSSIQNDIIFVLQPLQKRKCYNVLEMINIFP